MTDPLDSRCEEWGDGLIVCLSGRHELRRDFESTYRWCFGCRRRVRYNLVLTGDRGPSYYEPVWSASCPNGCGDAASSGFWYVEWNGGDE